MGGIGTPIPSYVESDESPAAHQKPLTQSGIELQQSASPSVRNASKRIFVKGAGGAMELEDREHWVEQRRSGCFWSSLFAFIGVTLGIALNEVRFRN